MNDTLEFTVHAGEQFHDMKIPETTQFKNWIGTAIGWRLLDYRKDGDCHYIKIQKIQPLWTETD